MCWRSHATSAAPTAVDYLFALVRGWRQPLDILINNAGIAHPNLTVGELPYPTWMEVIDTNLSGLFLVTQAALAVMKRGGTIVNNLSIAAERVLPGSGSLQRVEARCARIYRHIARRVAAEGNSRDRSNARRNRRGALEHAVAQSPQAQNDVRRNRRPHRGQRAALARKHDRRRSRSDALNRRAVGDAEEIPVATRLAASIGVASLFLRPDTLVMTARGRSSPEKAHRTAPASKQFDLPLIILVNGDTASAAEVLAAALQEHDRALIAGEPTYGKGVVQSVTALSESTGLALTTAQYFTPSGRSIQRPLPGTALATPGRELDPGSNSGHFFTDDGRPLAPSGGIAPDVEIPSRKLDPWLAFLNQTGTFTNFASEYLTLHGRANRSFEPDAAMLGDFKEFLTQGGVRTPEEFWGKDQDYVRLRIKVELLNLVSGLSSGEEVETKGDPQVQKAASLFSQIPQILKGPATKR